MKILDQLKFNAIQRPDGLTYDQLKVWTCKKKLLGFLFF
jgi:hypothetical protein